MEFVTCCVCGNRVQQSNGIDICGLCIKTKGDRVKILAIKKYLEKHPNASALELVETLEIKPREDEIGTPYCVTVDFDTLEDESVTIRDRDTMEQVRVKIDELEKWIEEKVEF